jgi:phosphoglycolate phosphatase-like HAD superfamily hydrolase
MHICFFDIDGTLLNTGGAGQAAVESALETEFGVSGPIDRISMAGRTDRAIALDVLAFYGIEEGPDVWQRFRAAYFRELPKSLARRDGLVLPGVVQLLELLSRREDVLVALLTGNFREGARLKLQHYGLHEHFEFGGFGDDHAHRDDVAREALHAARRYCNGVIPLDLNRTWVIGDTPADVQCGRAIGAKVVAVATGSFTADELQPSRPDHLFDDFSDPGPFLALLDS